MTPNEKLLCDALAKIANAYRNDNTSILSPVDIYGICYDALAATSSTEVVGPSLWRLAEGDGHDIRFNSPLPSDERKWVPYFSEPQALAQRPPEGNAKVGSIDPIGDTKNAHADRIINRLMSSDPDFDDCTAAAAMIRRLVKAEQCCKHGIHYDNACGACIPPRGTRVGDFSIIDAHSGKVGAVDSPCIEDQDGIPAAIRMVIRSKGSYEALCSLYRIINVWGAAQRKAAPHPVAQVVAGGLTEWMQEVIRVMGSARTTMNWPDVEGHLKNLEDRGRVIIATLKGELQ